MNPYLRMDVRTASPEALIGRLLDRAVALVGTSIRSLESDPVESARTTGKAIDIVSELRNALDAEAGGEVAQNLDALYEFVGCKLVLGNTSSEVTELQDALRVLETVAGGWAELLEQRAGAA